MKGSDPVTAAPVCEARPEGFVVPVRFARGEKGFDVYIYRAGWYSHLLTRPLPLSPETNKQVPLALRALFGAEAAAHSRLGPLPHGGTELGLREGK